MRRSRRVYSQSGDRIEEVGPPVEVRRYGPVTRANHWVTALSLILLLLSGLALFHPSLFFLTGLFGGGQTTRWIHPIIGIILFVSFFILFFRLVRLNLPRREDVVWVSHINDLLKDKEEKLPELGKYNAGQKFIFWAMSGLIVVLIVTGLMMWEQYTAHLVSIPVRRIATLVHALAAVLIICVFILHVYAAFWTRGTLSAMTRGTVTGGWSWKHHRKWLKELARRRQSDPAE
ncbi:formate dehydrogenase subunit gamma [Haematobacter genomosp. 1]|uniref:Formate dehydrogenase subunit gamma n=1 Tax=Haematobacter genomosp. 1 TaxID=366618 RepID=A0A212AD54_9RHOB|nr:formate dehydrogenase subunit gamma [Haematobacter genomosp. 1]OWJ78929.1 formate dehydrogenase subunit gamma [Haematobacter genomosp. 1]